MIMPVVLYSMSHPKKSDEILKEVEEKLKSYPFRFKGATILSGQEEGAYGWVTVNYLLENFIKVVIMMMIIVIKILIISSLSSSSSSSPSHHYLYGFIFKAS